MTGIISIRIQPPPGFLRTLVSGQKVTAKQGTAIHRAEFNRVTVAIGKSVAEVAKRRMSEQLAPKHKYNIGASGAASENLEVRLARNAQDYSEWVVFEGGKTAANAAIRQGIQPGERVPIPVLRKWAGYKGLTLTYPKKDAAKMQVVTGHWRTSKNGVRSFISNYGRAKKNKNTARAALYAIQNALYAEGSFRPGSNWYIRSPYPKRVGRFDYVVWTLKQEAYFTKALKNATNLAVTAIVDYLASGRKVNVSGRYFGQAG